MGGAQVGRGAVREELSEGGGTFFQIPYCQAWKAPRVSRVSPCLQTQLVPSSKVLSQLANTVRGESLNHGHHFPAPLSPALAKVTRAVLLPNPKDT